MRALVERILTRAGYEVVAAPSADRALELYAQDTQGFHLVLTDLVMPGITGVQLAARLHKLAPAQAVLLMSGHSPELFAPDQPTPDNLLPKPFTADTLRAAVHDALAANGAAASRAVTRHLKLTDAALEAQTLS